ncbi:hypothetical protein IWQ61_006845 [Dispira simplex]|nr:hypothetical protein IWQ61_006845 [Dispira simplex]
MGEAGLVVSAVILYFIFRWLLGDNGGDADGQNSNATTGRYRVQPTMVERVQAMFPHIPEAAIRADLARTGSIETTCDNILRQGSLPLPPGAQASRTSSSNTSSHTAGQSSAQRRNPNHLEQSIGVASSSSTAPGGSTSDSLIKRFNLGTKLDQTVPDQQVYQWETDASSRQEQLRRRKELMILQARRKLLEREKQA